MLAIFVESVLSLAFLATTYHRFANRDALFGEFPNLFRDYAALMAADSCFIILMLVGFALLRSFNKSYSTIRMFSIALVIVTIFRLITALIFLAPPNGENALFEQENTSYQQHPDSENTQYEITYHHEIAAIIIINICAILLLYPLYK
jgi:uncharacterized membrane protein (DUF485 family)